MMRNNNTRNAGSMKRRRRRIVPLLLLAATVVPSARGATRLALSSSSPPPLRLLLPLLLSSAIIFSPHHHHHGTPSSFFAEAQASYGARDGRRRRREEEDKERRTNNWWNDDDDDYDYDDGDDSATSINVADLFVTRKPRDAIEGFRSGLSNAVRGTFYGVVAAIASPVTGLKAFGVGGGIVGLLVGVVAGAFVSLTGFVAGGYQMLRGLAETPAAISDGFWGCKLFDEDKRSWEEYRLDEDAEEIERAMKREEEERKVKGENQSNDDNNGASRRRRKVKNSEYYDLLGVPTDAAPSEVRSAYRKRARKIHPDKNPDDPDAERKFRELSAAYQTLSDPAKRKRYDSSGVGVDPEGPDNANGNVMVDPIVFFAVLFGSEAAEPYIGELGMATAFDSLLKLGNGGAGGASIDSWEDVRTAFGWNRAAWKRRKRETDIALHLRTRVADYVDGFLAIDAFRDSCWEEALGIAKGGGYGASFLLAIGPALVAEADAFLGYRTSVLSSWRGPVSNAKRNILYLRRKWGVTKSVMRTLKESVKALYQSAEMVPVDGNNEQATLDQDIKSENNARRKEKYVFNDKELLKDNLSNTIPAVLDMAWAINYVDISNALYGACSKLFHDADVPSWEERLRRAEAVHILGSQFYLVGLEATGGNATSSGGGDVDDIKARANAAFMESLKKGMQDDADRRPSSDEM